MGPTAQNLLLLVLASLAAVQLRSELHLLLDHFTWSALGFTLSYNPLAILTLLALPLLWRRS